MSDFWGQQPPPNNQPPWGQQPPPQSPTQQPWGQTLPQSPAQPPWGQQYPPQSPTQQPIPNQSSWSQPPTQQHWGQQPIYNGLQQPIPGQFQQAPQSPKKKRNRLWLVLGIVGGVLVLSCVLCGVISNLPKTSNTASATGDQTSTPIDTSTKVAQVAQPTTLPTATPTPKPTPKPKPTATPIPTETSSQVETDYKASTTDTTVANLDKDGSADTGKDVHFTCTILKFVKDSSGNTSGANVTTQDTSAIVQVAFTSGTDITKLNEGDTLEVWGTDEGVYSGANAFGATVQEVGITAQYMLDQTTNYQIDN